jgi:hypothetical protein
VLGKVVISIDLSYVKLQNFSTVQKLKKKINKAAAKRLAEKMTNHHLGGRD